MLRIKAKNILKRMKKKRKMRSFIWGIRGTPIGKLREKLKNKRVGD